MYGTYTFIRLFSTELTAFETERGIPLEYFFVRTTIAIQTEFSSVGSMTKAIGVLKTADFNSL